jgi:peptidoglycan/LPS O-acetylase OafA/YrhL
VTPPPQAGVRGHGYQLPALDAMRAVGSLAVLVTHVGFQTGMTVNTAAGAVVARLDVGVALFFGLSGLLLVLPWADTAFGPVPTPSARAYLWRRALRILPAYWLAVVAALAFLPENANASAETWVANLLLVQIYSPGLIAPGLTQMWSLATEVAFYLCLPLIAAGLVRLARRWGLAGALSGALALGLAGLAWIAWIQNSDAVDSSIAALWLPGYLPWFGVGLALGFVVAAHRAGQGGRASQILHGMARAPWSTWGVGLGLLLVASTPVTGPRGLGAFQSPVEAIAKATLYAAVVALLLIPATFGSTGTAHRILVSAPMRWLGRISYGIFLWHLIVLAYAFQALGIFYFTGGFATVLAVTLVGSLAAAQLSWALVEQPVQRWGRRRAWTARQPAPARPTGPAGRPR